MHYNNVMTKNAKDGKLSHLKLQDNVWMNIYGRCRRAAETVRHTAQLWSCCKGK